MRWGKIFVFGAFIFASVANAQDVTVDLSVLDDLDAPETNISQPLFPVLPKKTAVFWSTFSVFPLAILGQTDIMALK